MEGVEGAEANGQIINKWLPGLLASKLAVAAPPIERRTEVEAHKAPVAAFEPVTANWTDAVALAKLETPPAPLAPPPPPPSWMLC